MGSKSVGAAGRLLLANFLPFRLNRLADAVSTNLSEIYWHRFGLDIPQWRVLVTLAQRDECTAQHIVHSTRMHKSRVSRAVAALEERQLIDRAAKSNDARELPLRLTRAGRRLCDALAPLALERERTLLACLPEAKRQALGDVLALMENSLGLHADE